MVGKISDDLESRLKTNVTGLINVDIVVSTNPEYEQLCIQLRKMNIIYRQHSKNRVSAYVNKKNVYDINTIDYVRKISLHKI